MNFNELLIFSFLIFLFCPFIAKIHTYVLYIHLNRYYFCSFVIFTVLFANLPILSSKSTL